MIGVVSGPHVDVTWPCDEAHDVTIDYEASITVTRRSLRQRPNQILTLIMYMCPSLSSNL